MQHESNLQKAVLMNETSQQNKIAESVFTQEKAEADWKLKTIIENHKSEEIEILATDFLD